MRGLLYPLNYMNVTITHKELIELALREANERTNYNFGFDYSRHYIEVSDQNAEEVENHVSVSVTFYEE